MSDFYAQRRTAIKDGVALVAFMLGWFAAGPFAWPYISEAFDQGDPAKGVLRFLLVVFLGGVAFGAIGLLIGHTAGALWQRMHERNRIAHPPVDRDAPTNTEPHAAVVRERVPLPALRIETGEIDHKQFAELLAACGLRVPSEEKIPVLLLESIVVGAWDGERLVGIARIVTDCAVSAYLAELAVHPSLQRRGLGRALLAKAFDTTPIGELGIVAPRGTGPFFEAVGCERAVASFVLRRPVK